MKTALLAMLALQSAPLPQYAWECALPARTICGASGCVESEVGLRVRIEPAERLYIRCPPDRPDECRENRASLAEHGDQRLFQIAGQPHFAQVAPDLSIVEAVTLGDQVHVSRGTCQEGPPAIRLR